MTGAEIGDTHEHVRDPMANPAAVLAARQRPMSERLALALSWNSVTSRFPSPTAPT